MKKKLLTLILAATMALSFAACGSNGNDSTNNRSSSTASSAPSTESSAPAASSTQTEADTMTLEEWLKTDDAKQAESATNAQLASASSGMSVKLAADGDIFVYEYTLTDGDVSGLTTEDLAAAFDPVIEANAQGLTDLFSSFEDTYGIKLDGVRFTFLTADGTELYSGDVANE